MAIKLSLQIFNVMSFLLKHSITGRLGVFVKQIRKNGMRICSQANMEHSLSCRLPYTLPIGIVTYTLTGFLEIRKD